jgi:hypothetical protein
MKKRFILCGIVSLFLLFFSIDCALAATDSSQAQSSKHNQWNYSQGITITENADKTLTNYPVFIYLNNSNFNFSKAKTDGSDIRFFFENKSLSYWIEKWDLENEEAVIWVKIPDLPAKKDSEILMKYGNSGAKNMSSGKKTFSFFDDFERSTLSDLDWNSKGTGGGTFDVEDGICKIIAPAAHAYDSSTIYSKKTFGINSMFVIKRKKVTTGTDNRGPQLRQGFIDRIESRKNEIKLETELANESRVGWETFYKDQRYNEHDLTDTLIPEGNWYVSGVAWFNENNTSKIAWFKNGVRDSKMDYASNDQITSSPMHIYLYAASNPDSSKNTGYMAVDYVLVRKFVGIEPTVKVDPVLIGPNASIENVSANASTSASEKISGSTVSSGLNPNNEASTPNPIQQVQMNQSENKTDPSDILFPEYNVNTSGIKLSSPYQLDSSVLTNVLSSSRVNTIFLNVDNQDIWQYERFVKTSHDKGISVHAVIMENLNCSEKGALNTCQNSLNVILDYNRKSLAPFDGIDIYIKPSTQESSENSFIDYKVLCETARQKAGENVSISVSIPPHYPASEIDKIAPSVDFFIVRAYCGDVEGLNSIPKIVDAIAPQMGEIRGVGSRGLIEVSVDEGFEDKASIQKLFADIVNYYSNDSAFLGFSISNYDTYSCLPTKADAEKKKFLIPKLIPKIPGFQAFSILIAVLGAIILLKVKKE